MMWPSPQEYNEAVQNPKLNFNDPELKGFSPQLNKFGMPVPNTGAFATVYRFNQGNRSFAVRCFLNYYPDQEERYNHISSHLKSQQLDCMVPFEFQRQGIRVNGTWYPILKMEWINGERIDTFIFQNLNNPAALSSFSEKWLQMIASLRAAKIAHGDLQHGNVIVSAGKLKLIDYDGMFVPALVGRGTHEIGHRNYQHPLRHSADFGLELDNFSAWVIYASLLGFSLDKSLWAQVNAGDERLLFGQSDYKTPAQSDAISILRRHPNTKLRALAEETAKLPGLGVMNLPRLEESSKQLTAVMPAPSSGASASAGGNTSQSNSKKCALCGKKLLQKTIPSTYISYWQCEDSPACKYRLNDGDDVAAIVAPPAPASPLVFFDPSSTGAGPAGAAPVSKSQTGPASSHSQSSTASAGAKPTAARRGRSSKSNSAPAAAPCPFCGSATTVTKTATPQRICFNFPTCLFLENC